MQYKQSIAARPSESWHFAMKYSFKTMFSILLLGTTVLVFFLVKLLLTPSTKYILYWNPQWNLREYFIGFGYKPFKRCQYKNCYATGNRDQIPVEKADMVVFYAHNLNTTLKLPEIRLPHQRYILLNPEAPANTCPDLKPWNSFFNWTMSYRFDSDVVRRYGRIVKRENVYQMPSEELFKKKTKMAAWFVSKCRTSSQRELLAKELKKYIPVDVYGKCGKFKCARKYNLSTEMCYKMIEREYKFYFSFENSFCKDYTTEKLYYVLSRNIVPVVYGAGDYATVAPPNSVINAADFDSVKSLAKHLQEVAADYRKYVKYFEWKKSYGIDSSDTTSACQLCRKLNEDHSPSVYFNIEEWWWGKNKSMCRLQKNLPEVVSNLL